MAGFTVPDVPLVESGFLVPGCEERSLRIVVFPTSLEGKPVILERKHNLLRVERI